MSRVATLFHGHSLMARVLRSASWLMIGYGGSQAMRLAANLVLTRLLFPEAFGLMALVSMVTVGLSLFSDVGVGTSIAQNKRGDEPEFLNTAWSIQIIRGLLLWVLTALLAWPTAQFYGAPELLWYLPIAGSALAITGFFPTRIETANRHLLVGRLTLLDLISQATGIAIMVTLALITHSVMALVLGGVIQAVVKLALTHYYLPGFRNRFRWEKSAANEIIHFGKWIFLSTAFWFATSQGDRAILGKFVPLDVLGIYNIGYFLASFPMLLGQTVNQGLMIPVYREKPVAEAPDNRRKQRILRSGLSSGILFMLLLMAWTGPGLATLLYDARYDLAGPIIVLIAVAQVPAVIGLTYDRAALAAGDSRSFFVFTAARAVLQTVFFLTGVIWFGLAGGVASLGLSMLMAYPFLIWLAVKHHVWDPLHDFVFFVLAGVFSFGALWWHQDKIIQLINTLD